MTTDAAPTEPGLSIVVVTWNSSATLAPLLAELTGHDDLEIIVADNDSADDSLAVAAAAAPDAIRIRTGGNCGFAGGVNAGAAAASKDVLVLLNPDCVAAPDDLRHLADRVRGGLGIAAPRLTDESGAVTRSVRRRPTLLDQFVVAAGLHKVSDRLDPDSDGGASSATAPVEVDVVSGACFATPLALFHELGGLDERFFLYGEEVDYMVRVAEAGHAIEYDPAATVMHIGGTAADQVSTGTDFLLMESRVRWFRKHHGRVAAQLARVALAAWALRRRDRAAIRAMFRPMKTILTPTHPRPKPVRVDE
ncbi:MAG: glycosyltransferase family 2 protein [Acidimicrobiales bacterium]|nr:glycosyltransferase family 2 protein [Acidimicrobiales bacterium]